MYHSKKVTVILPTYNEKDSIKQVIEEFEALDYVDEVIVINNNAAIGTSEEVAATNAMEIVETVQGYGAAIMRGLRESDADLVVVCEPDGTFLARDIGKLLEYSADFDVVYGSRTMNDMIWEGANMGWFLRVGNWAVAKLMEVLFNTCSLSDVGCTYRLLDKNAKNLVLEQCYVRGEYFGPEMMIATIKAKLKIVQIPVNYKERVGESSVTGSMRKAFILGTKMILLIIKKRFTNN